jgi:hypothetical protein
VNRLLNTLCTSGIEIADNALLIKRHCMIHTTPVLSSRVRLNWIVWLLIHIVQFNLLFVTDVWSTVYCKLSFVRGYAAQCTTADIHRGNLYKEEIQYCETNVMHFLFSLLRIKGLYMFPALLAHPQEALHSGTWYTACVLSVGCSQDWSGTGAANWHNTHAIYQVLFVYRLLRISK